MAITVLNAAGERFADGFTAAMYRFRNRSTNGAGGDPGGSFGERWLSIPAVHAASCPLLGRQAHARHLRSRFDGDFANPPIKRPTLGSCSRGYHPPAVRVK